MKTGTGYKLFRQDKNGFLHPLYVGYKETIPFGEWVMARDDAPRNEKGKVKGKMELHYRPGFHIAGSKPEAPQITNQKGCVWCIVEYCADVDWNPVAQENGRNTKGVVVPIKAELQHLPTNGWYYYKTSHKQREPWIICDRIKVIKILTAEEVETLCK